MRKACAIMLMLMVSIGAFPKSKFKRICERVDSMLRARYERVTYDTLYISRPDRRFTLRLKGNLSGNSIRYKNVQDGNDSHANISTDPRGTISLGASYMGIAASYSINPGKLSGRNTDYEFNLNASSNHYIVDLSYQRSKTLSGDISGKDRSFHLDKGYLKMSIVNITACYIFNHRRFSYPAAFSQSYFQKRSAGSWLAGLSFMGGSINTAEEAPEGSHDLNIKVRNIAIGGGYGYNFVCRKLLFHLSLMPTIIAYNYNNITMDGTAVREYTHFPDLIMNCRAAIVYNISPRYFIAGTTVFHSSVLGSFDHYTSQTKWRAHVAFGFRL